MRGSLTFKVHLTTQAIQCQADLYEMTDFDLLRLSTALNEQAFKLQMTLIQKSVEKLKAQQVIKEAASFKAEVDKNGSK